MRLLDEIRATLDAAGIDHALVGALALSAYGVNRATLDLDLFTTAASCLRSDFWADLALFQKVCAAVQYVHQNLAEIERLRSGTR
jgi:hypothetical protein